jgi:hypothetical protein
MAGLQAHSLTLGEDRDDIGRDLDIFRAGEKS